MCILLIIVSTLLHPPCRYLDAIPTHTLTTCQDHQSVKFSGTSLREGETAEGGGLGCRLSAVVHVMWRMN
jgi:hypothetical protein